MPDRDHHTPVVARARVAIDALEHLVGGLATSVLALGALLGLAVAGVLCLVGVGFLLTPTALRAVRVVADRERGRLKVPGPARPAVPREIGWLALHAVTGLILGLAGLAMALNTVRDGTFPLYWGLLPEGEAVPSLGLWTVHDMPGALAVGMLGVGWVFVSGALLPWLARLQALPGRRLLRADTDLARRIAQLTATRAAALDAHATELRRIERSLHDGTQNRLVAVNVMLGGARRALTRDPGTADAMLGRAQDAAEAALVELRAVVRSILPPVLTDRSLPDALTALAATCPVDCRIDADVPGRCPASVAASVYFVVAEALTNIARHSQARHASVVLRRRDDLLWLRITDDGRGGADERDGSGLDGIRRRVEAHDGTFTLASPVGGPTTLTASLPCGL